MTDFENKIESLVNLIKDDYRQNRVIDKLDIFQQPSKGEIIKILNKLQSIMYPGYFRNNVYKFYTIGNNMSMLLEDALFNLIKQTNLVLKQDMRYKEMPADKIEKISREKIMIFMEKIPLIREYLNTDIEAAYLGDPAAYSKEEIIFSYPGLYAIFVNRIAHQLYKLDIPVIPRIMTEYAHGLTGIDIHPGAAIGKYFFIDHGTGVVIGETTIIGDNVKIYQGVTLGALSTNGGQKLKNIKRHPTLGNNVTVYSGTSILGGDTVIGNNVVIGGNCFIISSVSEGSKVVMKPFEMIYK
ncbi:serine acetyltransferase [Porcipelethomonas ammoniilytica]|uniref:serine O-acetyltransferase EpsC n=1 Tax=Porcipelethomonas ammoniilytica TaxID=2981722 RepID=UPI0008224900|nr:serine O-acetyltransferase EpsC [Porcipelethomonas ammoniilytica]MCU6719463.1 serine acetyltransferase [Porcipelethomonas ammoniilytica]MEE0185798.1 serine O-acetyltransferase EpsC [Oscillospiraceae bacterium]SCI81351.1 Serine acetyltransferase [uncultured Ruminococcus sp.]